MVGKVRYLLIGIPLIGGLLYLGLPRESSYKSGFHNLSAGLPVAEQSGENAENSDFRLPGENLAKEEQNEKVWGDYVSNSFSNTERRINRTGENDLTKEEQNEKEQRNDLAKEWQAWGDYVSNLASFLNIERRINQDGTDIRQYEDMITLGPGLPYGFDSWDKEKKIETIKEEIEWYTENGYWAKAAILAGHIGEELDYDFGAEQIYCEAAQRHREQFARTDSSPHLISAFVASLKCGVESEDLGSEIVKRELFVAAQLALAKAGLYKESIEMLKKEAKMLEKKAGFY